MGRFCLFFPRDALRISEALWPQLVHHQLGKGGASLNENSEFSALRVSKAESVQVGVIPPFWSLISMVCKGLGTVSQEGADSRNTRGKQLQSSGKCSINLNNLGKVLPKDPGLFIYVRPVGNPQNIFSGGTENT